MVLKHFGLVTNGQRHYYNDKLHKACLSDLEGKEFEETIKLKFKRVSCNAFAYYYGAVIGTALQAEMFGGWDKDEMDDFFSDMFLTSYKTLRINHPGSEKEEHYTIKKVRSKGNGFTSKEMVEFVDKVIIWLAQNDIVVPPSENYSEEN
jgi:hypothetical protein